MDNLAKLYHKSFKYLSIYGLFIFTFIWSFSDYFIPLLFGKNFSDTSKYAKEMFLVILIFPTIFLQANVIVAIKLEKLDMLCNLVTLLLNVSLCIIGLHYLKNLSVVNYSVFISFLIFHIIQDLILIKNNITQPFRVLMSYMFIIISFLTYTKLSFYFLNCYYFFFIFWVSILFISMSYYYISNRKSV